MVAELVNDLALVLGQDIPRYRAVRTEHELYVQWYDVEHADQRHEYELYDLRADPYELDNLLATPEGRRANQDRWLALHERLQELAACSGASCRS